MKKYQIIYADPSWRYDRFQSAKATERSGPDKHYQTMETERMCELPIKEMSADESVLFVWGTWAHLPDVLHVLGEWGFKYKTVGFVWVKTRRTVDIAQASFFPIESFEEFFGMGTWTRSNTEFCLIATRGNPKPISHSVRQIIYSPIREHSRKPDEVKARIVELMGDLPRVELFARQKTEGWDVWGNEVESDIVLTP